MQMPFYTQSIIDFCINYKQRQNVCYREEDEEGRSVSTQPACGPLQLVEVNATITFYLAVHEKRQCDERSPPLLLITRHSCLAACSTNTSASDDNDDDDDDLVN